MRITWAATLTWISANLHLIWCHWSSKVWIMHLHSQLCWGIHIITSCSHVLYKRLKHILIIYYSATCNNRLCILYRKHFWSFVLNIRLSCIWRPLLFQCWVNVLRMNYYVRVDIGTRNNALRHLIILGSAINSLRNIMRIADTHNAHIICR